MKFRVAQSSRRLTRLILNIREAPISYYVGLIMEQMVLISLWLTTPSNYIKRHFGSIYHAILHLA